MGVKGLTSFISKRCPDTMKRVSIEELVRRHRLRNPSVNNIKIVIDTKNCFGFLSSQSDNMLGGQFLDYLITIQHFVQAFKDVNITLVFFYSQLVVNKLEYWLNKKEDAVDDIGHTYSQIKANRLNLLQTKHRPLSFTTQLALRFLSLNDPSIEVYCCFTDASDTIITQYAKENNCLAILSDDSDFIIFDVAPVMSVRHLNLEDMTAVVYDQGLICKSLNIRRSELATLASLIGNEIILPLELTPLHQHIFKSYVRNRRFIPGYAPIEFIGRFIEKNRRNNCLIEKVMEEEVRKHTSDATANLFTNSVKSYKLENNDLSFFKSTTDLTGYKEGVDLLNYIKQQTAVSNVSGIILEIILTNKIAIPKAFEDPDDDTLTDCAELFRPIRKKLYSLIYNSPELTKEDVVNEIWVTKVKEHRMDDVIPEDVIVNDKVACMTDLWKRAASPSEENRIFQLKCLLVCFGFTPEYFSEFDALPQEYKPLCLVVAFMSKQLKTSMKQFEVEAFVVQALLPNARDVDHWKKYNFKKWESRGCHLASLFLRGVLAYFDASSICGTVDFENIGPWKYFDGKRFQFCYQKLNGGCLDDNAEKLKMQMMSFITKETF